MSPAFAEDLGGCVDEVLILLRFLMGEFDTTPRRGIGARPGLLKWVDLMTAINVSVDFGERSSTCEFRSQIQCWYSIASAMCRFSLVVSASSEPRRCGPRGGIGVGADGEPVPDSVHGMVLLGNKKGVDYPLIRLEAIERAVIQIRCRKGNCFWAGGALALA